MKVLFAAALLASSLAAPAIAADVGVSLQFSQPGVYGRVDIGQVPQPQVVLPQPVIIGRPVVANAAPIYLWVPPAHRRDWRHHCAEYRACGVPVYFVEDRWYGEHVRPHERGRDERHEERRDEHREARRDDGHGRGEGRRD